MYGKRSSLCIAYSLVLSLHLYKTPVAQGELPLLTNLSPGVAEYNRLRDIYNIIEIAKRLKLVLLNEVNFADSAALCICNSSLRSNKRFSEH